MDELDVVGDLDARLDRIGVPYMLTGSLAMSYYAEPRMTRDVDLVVEVAEGDAERMVAVLDPAYYVSLDAAREAVRHRSMFNAIHLKSLVKADFILRKDEPYRLLEFERRRKLKLGEVETWIVSKEDLIISKAYWARDTRSEQQLRDIESLLGTGYDGEYLERWIDELGLHSLIRPLLP